MSNSLHFAAGQIGLLATCPTTRLQKPNFVLPTNHPDRMLAVNHDVNRAVAECIVVDEETKTAD